MGGGEGRMVRGVGRVEGSDRSRDRRWKVGGGRGECEVRWVYVEEGVGEVPKYYFLTPTNTSGAPLP